MTEQQQEIQANNVLLAEFMGLTKQDCGGYLCSDSQEIIEVENLTYDSDWQMLMQVVDKIESIKEPHRVNKRAFEVVITLEMCHISTVLDLGDDFFDETENDNPTKIGATFNTCVAFVKWYNENKGTCSKQ